MLLDQHLHFRIGHEKRLGRLLAFTPLLRLDLTRIGLSSVPTAPPRAVKVMPSASIERVRSPRASMMAPDYTQWHGMFEVAERFYMKLIPEARALLDTAQGKLMSFKEARRRYGVA